jgi:hypothetical protein
MGGRRASPSDGSRGADGFDLPTGREQAILYFLPQNQLPLLNNVDCANSLGSHTGVIAAVLLTEKTTKT